MGDGGFASVGGWGTNCVVCVADGMLGLTGSWVVGAGAVLLDTHVIQEATDSRPRFIAVIALSFLFNKLNFKAVLFIAFIVCLLGAASPCEYLYDVVATPSNEVFGRLVISCDLAFSSIKSNL